MLRHVITTRKMGVIDIYIDDIVYCTVVMDGIKAQIRSSSAQGDGGTGGLQHGTHYIYRIPVWDQVSGVI